VLAYPTFDKPPPMREAEINFHALLAALGLLGAYIVLKSLF